MDNSVPERCLRGDSLKDDADFDIVEDYNRTLKNENKKTWTRKTGVFHPSALSGCKRSLYYDRIGTEPKEQIPIDLRALFDMGHAVHDLVQSRLKDVGNFKAEVPAVYKPLDIYGHCDGVFTDKDWVVEIKSVGDSTFKSLVRPKKEHIVQAHCYMAALDVPRCQILYVNRNDGSMWACRIKFSNEVWEGIVDIINYVNSCVEKNEPPPKEPSHFWCRSCKFAYTCNPFNARDEKGYLS